jgi:hypothetical protein
MCLGRAAAQASQKEVPLIKTNEPKLCASINSATIMRCEISRMWAAAQASQQEVLLIKTNEPKQPSKQCASINSATIKRCEIRRASSTGLTTTGAINKD